MTHRMIFNQTGYFGRGAIAHIAPEIARRSLTKAFIVTDPVLADNGTAARITDLLDEAGIDWEIFSDVVPNPPIEKVQAGLAAYINGMAYSNVGLGLVHGMAHPLGGRYNAPHGVANGILLAPVMAFNAEHTGEKYRDIAEAFGVDGARTMPLEEARAAAVEAVAQLTRDLGNPTRISEVGVEADGIEALADDAFADVCTPGNPRPATREDIKALYTSLL